KCARDVSSPLPWSGRCSRLLYIPILPICRPLPERAATSAFDFKAQHKTFDKFGHEHPPIYTVFSPMAVVQITDFVAIREAFVDNGDAFSGRPANKIIQEAVAFAPNTGVTNANGDNWKEQRRTAIAILRDFGMGKNLMEEQMCAQVRSSVELYIRHLKSIVDKNNVDMRWPIQVMVSNVINDVLFGQRYTHEESKPLMDYVRDLNKYLDLVTNSMGIMLGMGFPFLAKLPWIGWHVFGKFKHGMEQVNVYIVANVDRILADYDVEIEPTCFVEAYAQKMRGNDKLDKVNLMATCADFFMGGQETTTTTLRWAMLLFAKNQDLQEKLRAEVHAVVGTDRLPTIADQINMPFARACALELQRFCNILVTNVFRVTTRDVEIRGQLIPEGTWVNGDIHYVMANDPLFEHPQKFDPSRYIAEDGKTMRKELIERTIPFSIGKRACPGKGIASVELFLGLTATFQHFILSPCEGEEIDLEPTPGLMLLPKPQRLRIECVTE
ncbi:hypothetical protein PRIPAC_80926, partial [Pristionchus pacificus]|uniref:Cytochrome P450 n=1 Tax=Pristionchus pacificus TaxID=54126 RepID=A0A2A6CKA7_PRIPA